MQRFVIYDVTLHTVGSVMQDGLGATRGLKMESTGKPFPRSSGKTATVFIVDDHPLVRHGLIQLIEGEPDLQICGDAADGAEALRRIAEIKPDLTVIDISLQDGSGIELIKQIKEKSPDTRMLVSSMHDESLYAERALSAGAMGYVSKESPVEMLLEAMRQVLSGRIYLSSRMADRVLHRAVHRSEEKLRSPLDTLSDRELEVLSLIGRGLSSRQIAEMLHLSVKTIDTYREHIKSKLDLKNANELVRYAVAWTLQST